MQYLLHAIAQVLPSYLPGYLTKYRPVGSHRPFPCLTFVQMDARLPTEHIPIARVACQLSHATPAFNYCVDVDVQ